jgi:hypothetical protein
MSIPVVPVDGTIWTKEFWIAAAERAIRTGATAAALVLIGDTYHSLQLNAFDIEWMNVLGFFLGGMLVSLLISVGANAKTGTGPSLTTETVQRAPRRALSPDEQTQKGWEP